MEYIFYFSQFLEFLYFMGFFGNFLWCYWMSVSLQYYDITYIAPFLLLGIGFCFGTIFALFAVINKLSFRILMILDFIYLSIWF